MVKMLYLIRGLPGAGKTTFAQMLMSNLHVEADMFFMKDGEYQFDASKLRDAHQWCSHRVLEGMTRNLPMIVVSNTFTTKKEMTPYLEMAKLFGYDVTTVIVENRRDGKSIHDVPAETIEKMRNRFNIEL